MQNIVSALPYVGPFAASTAVAVSLIVFIIGERAKKRSLTIEIWKIWCSKDYRNYRVTAVRAIKTARARAADTGESRPSYTTLLGEQNVEDALGTLEHFIYELASIKHENLLDRRLFRSLFHDNMLSWRDLLTGMDRTGADAFSEAELAAAFAVLLGTGHLQVRTKYFPGQPMERGHKTLRREGITDGNAVKRLF